MKSVVMPLGKKYQSFTTSLRVAWYRALRDLNPHVLRLRSSPTARGKPLYLPLMRNESRSATEAMYLLRLDPSSFL